MGAAFDDGLCLRRRDWSETSQTVVLLCRSSGLVRGLAKGSKRERAPFSGGFEPLTRGAAGIIFRSAARGADALDLLTGWDLSESFAGLRTDRRRLAAALYSTELLSKVLRPGDPHPELFDAALAAWRTLDAGGAVERRTAGGSDGSRERSELLSIRAVLLRLTWVALESTGHLPSVSADPRTGEPIPLSGAAGATLGFSPELGGVLGASGPSGAVGSVGSDGTRCVDGGAAVGGGRVWRVREGTIAALRAVAERRVVGGPETLLRAGQLLCRHLEHRLDIRLTSASMGFADPTGRNEEPPEPRR